MQKHVNLVDLVKSVPTNIFLQNLASIQKRTSPVKFAHLAEKSGKGSISNLSTKVTTTADDIEDTTAEMKETEAFLANLASQCALKKKEWAARQTMRAEEISAISEAIKVLNDDDASRSRVIAKF